MLALNTSTDIKLQTCTNFESDHWPVLVDFGTQQHVYRERDIVFDGEFVDMIHEECGHRTISPNLTRPTIET